MYPFKTQETIQESVSGIYWHFRGPWNYFWLLGAKKVKNPCSKSKISQNSNFIVKKIDKLNFVKKKKYNWPPIMRKNGLHTITLYFFDEKWMNEN